MLNSFVAFIAIVLLALSIISDIRTYKIPNIYSILIALCALVYSLMNTLLFDTGIEGFIKGIGYVEFLLAFIIGFIIFAINIIGAGDIKLIMAMALWLPEMFTSFLLFAGILGGIYSILLLLYGFFRKKRIKYMPYGVPIGIAGIFFIVERSQVLELLI